MKRTLTVGGIAIASVTCIWAISFCAVRAVWNVPVAGAESLAQYAQFGDSFGAVNALFTGLAFAGVIVALVLQREDIDASLREQRESTEAQRSLAKGTVLAAALEAKARFIEIIEKERDSPATEAGHPEADSSKKACAILSRQLYALNNMIDKELEELYPDWENEWLNIQ